MTIQRKPTRAVAIGNIVLGGGNPIVVQSMCSTKTGDVDATVAQIERLASSGAGIVRVAADNRHDCDALKEIRGRTGANLSVDLQESYRLAEEVAPWVDKIRYNPGHLYHHEQERPWQDKIRYLVDVAGANDCAMRVGVNSGSVDPAKKEKFSPHDTLSPMLESALDHCALLDALGFTRYCVSLKDSDPAAVVELNRRFAAERPDVPLHLGVTEAGMPPDGVWKSHWAFEQLLREGIGDTLRVSLTVSVEEKTQEVEAGQKILADVAAGRFLVEGDDYNAFFARHRKKLEIISCPSCSRVQSTRFVELAGQVREATRYAEEVPVSIAVMGCRVNGPGEADRADIGLWCGPNQVHLKRGSKELGVFSYEEILGRVKKELDAIIAERGG